MNLGIVQSKVFILFITDINFNNENFLSDNLLDVQEQCDAMFVLAHDLNSLVKNES